MMVIIIIMTMTMTMMMMMRIMLVMMTIWLKEKFVFGIWNTLLRVPRSH